MRPLKCRQENRENHVRFASVDGALLKISDHSGGRVEAEEEEISAAMAWLVERRPNHPVRDCLRFMNISGGLLVISGPFAERLLVVSGPFLRDCL